MYKYIKKKNPNKKRKILILIYDMITDMLSNENCMLFILNLYFVEQRSLQASFFTFKFVLRFCVGIRKYF